ncbi:MAG: hypothetical protein QXW97_04390 [Candidatus Pacearchaeota archaeon]
MEVRNFSRTIDYNIPCYNELLEILASQKIKNILARKKIKEVTLYGYKSDYLYKFRDLLLEKILKKRKDISVIVAGDDVEISDYGINLGFILRENFLRYFSRLYFEESLNIFKKCENSSGVSQENFYNELISRVSRRTEFSEKIIKSLYQPFYLFNFLWNNDKSLFNVLHFSYENNFSDSRIKLKKKFKKKELDKIVDEFIEKFGDFMFNRIKNFSNNEKL